MTTLLQFNEKLGSVFKSVLPEPVRTVDFNSLKRLIFDEFFGKGWETFGYGKQLISPDDIIFEDTPTGVLGVKAEGLREAFFNYFLNSMLILEKSPAFKEEMSDPDYRKTILNVYNRLLSMVASSKANCKTIIIEERDAKLIELQETEEGIYNLFHPSSKATKFLRRTKKYISSLKFNKDECRYKTAIEFKDKAFVRKLEKAIRGRGILVEFEQWLETANYFHKKDVKLAAKYLKKAGTVLKEEIIEYKLINEVSKNEEKRTPFYMMVRNGAPKTMMVHAIKHGAEVDAVNGQGCTPLFSAASRGKTKLIKFLLEEGADPCAKTVDGSTADQYTGDGEIQKLILDATKSKK